MKIIVIALLISILFESTVISMPLTLLTILFAAVTLRKNEVFIIAFLAGLILDILTMRTLGVSSLFFTVVTMLIFLYQRKFEIETLHFVIITALIGTLTYLFILGSHYLLFQTILSTVIILVSFFVYKKTNKKALKYA